MMMRKNLFLPAVVAVSMVLSSCAIRDDILYPIVESAITAFVVEGQCNADDTGFADAEIVKNSREVNVYVSDTVDVSKLHVRTLEVTNDGTIVADSLASRTFPTTSFSDSINKPNATADFSHGSVSFTLRTYQDYVWKVNVRQVMIRDVQLESQVGDAVIDSVNHNVVIYVSESQDLKSVKVEKFSLAGQHGTVIPDPTATATFDFSRMRSFEAISAATGKSVLWKVYVYKTAEQEETTMDVFVRSVSATITGKKPTGVDPVVEYCLQGTSDWKKIPSSQMSVTARAYTAEVTGLVPGKTYEYRVTAGVTITDGKNFTTIAEQQLPNNGFEDWSISGEGTKALYQPWGEGEEGYWDTGNAGATTVGASNSTYVDEGGRRYANLQSKYIVIKFAAGNIFTGQYVETDGTNGVLSFGRPFTSFPTKMRFEYKYKTSTITKSAPWSEAYSNYISREMYENMKGNPDSCSIYIALGDWEPVIYNSHGVSYTCPYLIRTRPSTLHLFDLNDEHLIAYAQLTKGEDVNEWTTETLNINYRVKNRRPKYIIVVASSSKYGDYFTGGEGSLLQLDNVELLYE